MADWSRDESVAGEYALAHEPWTGPRLPTPSEVLPSAGAAVIEALMEVAMPDRPPRDVEKVTSRTQFVEKLRRLADALEAGEPFTIQVANERFTVPPDAEMSVEHERGEDGEELELQLVWNRRR